MSHDITLPQANPRDVEVQQVVLALVEAFAFSEAAAVLNARLREIAATRQSHIEQVFLDWCALNPGERADFLTYAHHRRNPALGEAS